MVEIRVVYQGELRCRATHAPSASELVTDAPVDNHGRGEAFSPTDLVGTALGTCMLTIMGIVAQRHGWPLAGAEATVVKTMVADPRRRIGELAVEIRVPGEWSDAQRRALEEAAATCPVHASLRPEVSVPVRFLWGG